MSICRFTARARSDDLGALAPAPDGVDRHPVRERGVTCRRLLDVRARPGRCDGIGVEIEIDARA